MCVAVLARCAHLAISLPLVVAKGAVSQALSHSEHAAIVEELEHSAEAVLHGWACHLCAHHLQASDGERGVDGCRYRDPQKASHAIGHNLSTNRVQLWWWWWLGGSNKRRRKGRKTRKRKRRKKRRKRSL